MTERQNHLKNLLGLCLSKMACKGVIAVRGIPPPLGQVCECILQLQTHTHKNRFTVHLPADTIVLQISLMTGSHNIHLTTQRARQPSLGYRGKREAFGTHQGKALP